MTRDVTAIPATVKKLTVPFLLGVLLILGFCARVVDLDRESLWGDEINLTEVAILTSVAETREAVQVPHSYGYPVFLHFWMKGGEGEAFLRLPSLISGLAAIFLLWVLLRKIGNTRVAFMGALFLALADSQIRFSREVAAYSAQNAVLIGAALVWFLCLEKNAWWRWAGFALLAAASHYLHPLASTTTLGWFAMVPLVWYFGMRPKQCPWQVAPRSVSLWQWGASLLLFAILIYGQVQRNLEGAEKNVGTAAAAPSFGDYFQELSKLLGGDWFPFLPLAAVGAAYLCWRSPLLGLAITGWALGTVAVWIAFIRAQSTHFDYHYFVSHLPAFLALAAFGIEGLLHGTAAILGKTGFRREGWRTPAAAALALAIGWFHQFPAAREELARKWPNYRAVGNFLQNRLDPEDRFYIKPEYWMTNKVRYYSRDVLDREVEVGFFFDAKAQEDLRRKGGELYVVTHRPFPENPNYRSVIYHGAAVNWKDPRIPAQTDFGEVYRLMLESSGELREMDLLNEAKALRDAGQTEAAMTLIDRAVEMAPHHPRILRRRAEILAEIGRHEEAIPAFEAAFERIEEKEKWFMLASKADSQSLVGKHQEALESIDRAFQQDTRNEAYLYEVKGRELLALDKIEEARTALETSLQVFGGDRPGALLKLAEIAGRTGEGDQVAEYLERAAALMNEPQKSEILRRIQQYRAGGR
jgi:tetratricopeptide (TPR) repeat protein